MNNPKEHTTKLPNYGGQAVIEGVMMRGKKAAAIAMRSPDGEIIIHKEELNKIYQSRIMQIPFLRGLIGLYDALILGMKALTISANVQTGDEEKIEGPALIFTFALSMSIAVVIFRSAVTATMIPLPAQPTPGSGPPTSTHFTPL